MSGLEFGSGLGLPNPRTVYPAQLLKKLGSGLRARFGLGFGVIQSTYRVSGAAPNEVLEYVGLNPHGVPGWW